MNVRAVALPSGEVNHFAYAWLIAMVSMMITVFRISASFVRTARHRQKRIAERVP